MRMDSPAFPEITFAAAAMSKPVLVAVVDTEEEFDWDAEFRRENTAVSAMQQIPRLQQVFDEFGIRPCYVVDYAVASQREGYEPLESIAASGLAEIGAHLHPWITPPFTEALTRRNSFAGNLPPEIERAKIQTLIAEISRNLGVRPVSYKAGRYGVGPNSAAILEELGFEVDLSPAPPLSFVSEGGPDFSEYPVAPYWTGNNRLLVLPGTGTYLGILPARRRIYELAKRPFGERLRIPGILSRTRLADRLRLSPEGYSLADNRKLTRAMLARGTGVFVYSLHSTSVKPGCNPYVRNEPELSRFLDQCREYFEFFLNELGGLSMPPAEFRKSILKQGESDEDSGNLAARQGRHSVAG